LPAAPAQTSFLIVTDGFGGRLDGLGPSRLAVPLAAVERIETLPLAEIEVVAGRPMLRYRGELLAVEDEGGVLTHLRRMGSEEATLIICDGLLTAAAPAEASAGQRRSSRFAMAVGRVVDVADGEWIAEDRRPGADRMALVSERLMAVHPAFLPAAKEVA
jgi:two-component system chemotaxis sensor kinase CheA